MPKEAKMRFRYNITYISTLIGILIATDNQYSTAASISATKYILNYAIETSDGFRSNSTESCAYNTTCTNKTANGVYINTILYNNNNERHLEISVKGNDCCLFGDGNRTYTSYDSHIDFKIPLFYKTYVNESSLVYKDLKLYGSIHISVEQKPDRVMEQKKWL